jgi:DNA-binding FrmR family transcriptional regulator
VAHTIRDRTKLLNRVRRIAGQINSVRKLLDEESECGPVLQQLAACRGAINGLMGEILEDHIRIWIPSRIKVRRRNNSLTSCAAT